MHLGCPGATTVTMLDGGGHCRYLEGTQLGAAEAFLRTHPTTVLVTVDLGFNDLLPCMRHEFVDAACVDGALATVHDQLGQILARDQGRRHRRVPWSSGSATTTPISGITSRVPGGQAFSAASLGVMERLDETLHVGLPISRGAHGRGRLGLRSHRP